MESTLTAIELTGTIDEDQQLHLDAVVPVRGPVRVRVIVLYSAPDETEEADWLHAATVNPAFADLAHLAEDIYSPMDGKPFHDEA
jgi:hypothetical protein